MIFRSHIFSSGLHLKRFNTSYIIANWKTGSVKKLAEETFLALIAIRMEIIDLAGMIGRRNGVRGVRVFTVIGGHVRVAGR